MAKWFSWSICCPYLRYRSRENRPTCFWR
uniref:Uncharacterized protein n=1 Tax=Arundo donax TaxID=35708 RepID=A0A0A8YPP7_ARUDO